MGLASVLSVQQCVDRNLYGDEMNIVFKQGHITILYIFCVLIGSYTSHS